MPSYFERLTAITAQRGALCVGLDPHPQTLAAWGLDDDLVGLEKCARGIVEALGERVAVFKPQSAFYEVHGSAGIAVLERVLADIAQAGALSILDIKRGDIGSTMAGYARAYLADGAPLAADAITLSPYLGVESLRPAIDLAHHNGRGIYVLARTSNPEGGQVQLSRGDDGRSVAQQIVDECALVNEASGQFALGLVVGGTHADPGCDVQSFNGSILVPGIGAQGGRVSALQDVFGPATSRLLPSASRQVAHGGPTREGLLARLDEVLSA